MQTPEPQLIAAVNPGPDCDTYRKSCIKLGVLVWNWACGQAMAGISPSLRMAYREATPDRPGLIGAFTDCEDNALPGEWLPVLNHPQRVGGMTVDQLSHSIRQYAGTCPVLSPVNSHHDTYDA